jgi:hypothetical protein
MRLFALTVLALSEGQKLLTAARQENSKMPYPRELKDNAGICGRIQLRPDQPYGIQRPHKNKNGVPGKNITYFYLLVSKKLNCTFLIVRLTVHI